MNLQRIYWFLKHLEQRLSANNRIILAKKKSYITTITTMGIFNNTNNHHSIKVPFKQIRFHVGCFLASSLCLWKPFKELQKPRQTTFRMQRIKNPFKKLSHKNGKTSSRKRFLLSESKCALISCWNDLSNEKVKWNSFADVFQKKFLAFEN